MLEILVVKGEVKLQIDQRRKFSILGSELDMVYIPSIIRIMEGWIDSYDEEKKCKQIVVSGFHAIWEAYKDTEYREMLKTSDLWVPDGIAPVWVARLRGMRNVDRTPGAEIMQSFLPVANKRGYRSFFYGDTNNTLIVLKKKLEVNYPGHKVAGVYSPPFRPLTSEEDEAIIKMINDAKPDILWVGLGCPKQDRWIFEHKDRLKVPVAIGVGAVFKFYAGTVKRVPEWVGRNGLEWAWRFIMEPKKLWRRDLIDGPRFIFHVLLELIGLRKYK